MKKTLLAIGAGLATSVLLSLSANAASLTGGFTMTGTLTTDNGGNELLNATTFVTWSGTVASADGSFTTVLGDAINFHQNWTIGSAQNQLWAVGPGSYNTAPYFWFDLAHATVTTTGSAGSATMSITGTGSAYGADSSPTPTYFGTPFVWTFSAQDPAHGSPLVFSFSASTYPQSVPDSGSAVAMLGMALACVEGLRRRLSK